MNKQTKYNHTTVSAKSIYQQFLDDVSEALMAGDIDGVVDRHTMPHRFLTQNEDFVIETPQELAECVRLLRKNLLAMGADTYIRLASDAKYLRDDYIEGHHVTHTLKGANSVVPSYQNRMVLSFGDGRWRASVVQTELVNTHWPISTPQVDQSRHPTLFNYDPTQELRHMTDTPLAIYQGYLDALSKTNMTHDFDGWCALCDFPHNVHVDSIDEVINEPAEIRPFFDMLSGLIADHRIDTLARVADHAEFLSPTEICGYHTTSLSREGTVEVGPVSSRYILSRSGTVWRMRSVTNSIANKKFPYDMPKISRALISLREIKQRNKAND